MSLRNLLRAALLPAALVACTPAADAPSAAELQQTAVDAAIWGMPIVSTDVMRNGFLRDAGAQYGDVVYYSSPADWKLQVTTPNASARYVLTYFDLKDGPIVFDIPAAVGAGLFGSILDAWQVPIADVGPAGADSGKGGKYLLLPPGYTGEVPSGYFPLRFETFTGYGAFRAISEGPSQAAVDRALALVKKFRIYSLSQAGAPPESRHIDMVGKVNDGIVRYDESFFASLARMVEEEPAFPRDSIILGRLRTLGIEKGKPFAPDSAMQVLLRAGVARAHQMFMDSLPLDGDQFWPASRWRTPAQVGPRTEFTFVENGELDVFARGLIYFTACAIPKKLGKATVYLFGGMDQGGAALIGDSTYRLHVPAGVPASQFWAVTVYDLETAGFIREAPTVEFNSYAQGVKKNPDGSVDVYFGPKAPAGMEKNWVYTAPGKKWFSLFRFYGPQPALFDKSWSMGDIELVAGS